MGHLYDFKLPSFGCNTTHLCIVRLYFNSTIYVRTQRHFHTYDMIVDKVDSLIQWMMTISLYSPAKHQR